MSGIAGIVNLDESPVDPWLLQRLTAGLADRAPDGLRTWRDGHAGLGQAHLCTGGGQADRAPLTLDGSAWIVADARLDARADLIARLDGRAPADLTTGSDAELILHAYERWGEACVEHLVGDYAFAIWDRRRRALLCARDHFGVKPFYYACAGGAFVFSNTLDCLHLHSGVDWRLNERAIADFLRFGYNPDPATTSFASVQRLAPAHRLQLENGAVRCDRYWTLPVDARIRYRRSGEYVEHFRDLLRRAVSDRLPEGPVGIWMSGGLDSTAIAATARRLDERGASRAIRAFTTVFETLMPDDERRFATMAADALSIPIDFTNGDRVAPFAGFEQPEMLPPEATDDPYFVARLAQLRQASLHSRVLLCGEGGDEIFWASDVLDLLGRQPMRDLGRDLLQSMVRERRRPRTGVLRGLRGWRKMANGGEGDPVWLNRQFAERFPRRESAGQEVAETTASILRPEASRRLTAAAWPWYFESADPGSTRLPLEIRYPFLDVRLVSYAVAIPPLPWCIDKHLLRAAMRGLLPDGLRLRPKSPLSGDPLRAYLQAGGPRLTAGQLGADMDRYVDRAAVPDVPGAAADPWADSRPHCLDRWLRRARARALDQDGSASQMRVINEEAI